MAHRLLPLVASLLFVLPGCNFKPPQECPFTGTADTVAFSQQFESMVLVVEGTSSPPPVEDEFLQFQRDNKLELIVVSKSAGQIQVCVGEAKGGGQIAYSQTHSVTVGENRIALGTFKPNPYVVRIAYNSILVQNIRFRVN